MATKRDFVVGKPGTVILNFRQNNRVENRCRKYTVCVRASYLDYRVYEEERPTMSRLAKTTGFGLAVAAAAMLAAAPMAAHSGSTVGKCMGVNSCRGHSDCKTAKSSCRGRNSCAGKGFLEMSKAECDTAGGEFEA